MGHKKYGMWDNNRSRYVSIDFLNVTLPDQELDEETMKAYVDGLRDVPEEELRHVIILGLSEKWNRMPTLEDIRELWRDEYVPLDEMWQEVMQRA